MHRANREELLFHPKICQDQTFYRVQQLRQDSISMLLASEHRERRKALIFFL